MFVYVVAGRMLCWWLYSFGLNFGVLVWFVGFPFICACLRWLVSVDFTYVAFGRLFNLLCLCAGLHITWNVLWFGDCVVYLCFTLIRVYVNSNLCIHCPSFIHILLLALVCSMVACLLDSSVCCLRVFDVYIVCDGLTFLFCGGLFWVLGFRVVIWWCLPLCLLFCVGFWLSTFVCCIWFWFNQVV